MRNLFIALSVCSLCFGGLGCGLIGAGGNKAGTAGSSLNGQNGAGETDDDGGVENENENEDGGVENENEDGGDLDSNEDGGVEVENHDGGHHGPH